MSIMEENKFLKDIAEVVDEFFLVRLLEDCDYEEIEKPWNGGEDTMPMVENIDFQTRLLANFYTASRNSETLLSRELMIGVPSPWIMSFDVSLKWNSSNVNKEELDVQVSRWSHLLEGTDEYLPKQDFVIHDVETLCYYLCHVLNIVLLPEQSTDNNAEQGSPRFRIHCSDIQQGNLGDSVDTNNGTEFDYVYHLLQYCPPILDFLDEFSIMSQKFHSPLIALQRLPLWNRLYEEMYSDESKHFHYSYKRGQAQKGDRYCSTFKKLAFSYLFNDHRRKYLDMKKMHFLHKQRIEIEHPPPPPSKYARPSSSLVVRHRRILRDNIQGFTKDEIQKILRRAGILFEDGCVYEEIRGTIRVFMETLMNQVNVVIQMRRLNVINVVSCDDVLTALSLFKSISSVGRPNIPSTVYGYGVNGGIRHLFLKCLNKILWQVHPMLSCSALAMSIINDMVTQFCLDVLHTAHQLKKSDSTLINKEDAEYTTYEQDDLIINYDDDEEEREKRECDEEYHNGNYFGISYGEGTRVLEDTRYVDERRTTEVKFYFDFDDVPDGEADRDLEIFENHNLQIITVEAIEQACRSLFPKEIFKHMKSEATKAVAKFNRSGEFKWCADVGNGEIEETAGMCGIQMIPEYILLLSKVYVTAPKHILLHAAIYLAAAADYIAAEIIELSGNVTKGMKSYEISARHILLGIENDDDMKSVFPGVIRGGGVKKYIPDLMIPNAQELPLEYTVPGSEQLLNKFAEEVKQYGPRVNPLTGEYVMWVANRDAIQLSHGWCPALIPDYRSQLLPPSLACLANCSLLNAMSVITVDERQALALQGYGTEDQATWHGILSHPRLLWTCRLYEVIQEQEDILPAFRVDVMYQYALEVLQDFICDMDFTFEATLLMRTVLERYLVESAYKASKLLVNDGRIVLKPADWRVAYKM